MRHGEIETDVVYGNDYWSIRQDTKRNAYL